MSAIRSQACAALCAKCTEIGNEHSAACAQQAMNASPKITDSWAGLSSILNISGLAGAAEDQCDAWLIHRSPFRKSSQSM